MTLQEYEQQGGCVGCQFYEAIDTDGSCVCIFNWSNDESEDWNYSRNCEKISE